MIVPRCGAAWQHALGDVTPELALAFAAGGSSFDIWGVPLAEDSALVEAALDIRLAATTTLAVSYSGQFASESQDNAVRGRLSLSF